jgi:hypothetical protein
MRPEKLLESNRSVKGVERWGMPLMLSLILWCVPDVIKRVMWLGSIQLRFPRSISHHYVGYLHMVKDVMLLKVLHLMMGSRICLPLLW